MVPGIDRLSSVPSPPEIWPVPAHWPRDNCALPFSVGALQVRGRVVSMGPVLDSILARHDYPRPVNVLLGEAMVLAALLASTIKDAHRFILQVQTDGPVKLLVVDITQSGQMRATASLSDENLANLGGIDRIDPAALLGEGTLAMTIEQGQPSKRYQGVVALDGQDLEGAAHTYFRQSEQIPTRIRLAMAEMISRDEHGNPHPQWRAGGFIAQFLPESEDRRRNRDLPPGDPPAGIEIDYEDRDDDAWLETLALADTIEDHELTDPSVTADRLLFQLFNEHEVRVFEPQVFEDRCSCSRERIESVLASMSRQEVDDAAIEGKIWVTCEFCGARYEFNPDAISAASE